MIIYEQCSCCKKYELRTHSVPMKVVKIVDNFEEVWLKEFADDLAVCPDCPGFKELSKRISGKLVVLVGNGGDWFEYKDNNYVITKNCYTDVSWNVFKKYCVDLEGRVEVKYD